MLKSARIQSRNQYLQRYKRRLQKDEYKPGELVLVQNSRLEMTVNRFKTDPRYLGPYEVVRKTAGGAYKLQELDGAIFDKSIAAFQLLPYVTRGSPDFYKLFGTRKELEDPNETELVAPSNDESDTSDEEDLDHETTNQQQIGDSQA